MKSTAAIAAPVLTRSRPLFLAGALGIVYVVWGSTYLAIRIMVDEVPPLFGAGTRFLAAGLLVAAALALRGGLRGLALTGRQFLGCSLLAFMMLVLCQGMVATAEAGGAASGIAALLIAAVPLWVLCYRALAGERPTRITVAGVLAGFCGIAVVVTASGLGAAFPFWTVAALLVAGLSWAFGSWYQPRIELPPDPFLITMYEMLVGGAILTVIGLVGGERFDPLTYSTRSWAAWGYLVVFGSILAFSAYTWLLQSATISLATSYAYINPLVAVCLGWLILAEPITMPTLVGGLMVVLAVAVVVRSEVQR
ncbi:EamA family transporter [Pseudarthrobacter sp. NS4]|uniref:EamA family transporter n=1 Tax=Pseudarthrobacter sp. NS4 TaxID=2973976 RepID=UPI002161EECE|nr:EamA family transporter [Pseudarthrobacter sp. NS4]